MRIAAPADSHMPEALSAVLHCVSCPNPHAVALGASSVNDAEPLLKWWQWHEFGAEDVPRQAPSQLRAVARARAKVHSAP
jgi:hypothetical protein